MRADEGPDAGVQPPLPPLPAMPSGPMRVGAILETALARLRRRWRVVLLLALAFAGPAALFTATAGIRFNEVALDVFPGLSEGITSDTPLLTASQLERLGGALLQYALAALLAGVLGSLGAVALAFAVLDRERPPSQAIGAAVRAALRRALSVLTFMLITSAIVIGLLLVGLMAMGSAIAILSPGPISRGGPGVFVALVVGVALIVTLAWLTMRWAPAYPVMAMEDAGWRVALRRSWQLSAGHAWRIAFVVILGALLTALGAAVISQLLAVLVVDLLAGAVGFDAMVAESLVAALGSVLLAPLLPALLAVLYVDLRARHELLTGDHAQGPANAED